jgi:hypothetical protein
VAVAAWNSPRLAVCDVVMLAIVVLPFLIWRLLSLM